MPPLDGARNRFAVLYPKRGTETAIERLFEDAKNMRTTKHTGDPGGRLAQQMAIAQAMAGQNVRLHRPLPSAPGAEARAASTRVLVTAAVLVLAVAVLALLASA
jgi:hypothetical protein